MSSRKSKWDQMTDDEFREQVLNPVLAEAEKRKFTLRLDPFGVLTPRKRHTLTREDWDA